MRIVFAVASTLLGCWAVGPAAPVPTHLMPEPNFQFPTVVGTQWVYQTADGERVEEIERADRVEDGTRIMVRIGGARTAYLVSVDGLAVIGCTAPVALGEPFWIFRNDPRPWASRQWTCRLVVPGAFEAEGTCLATGPEKITVPAGTFQAVKVKLDMTLHDRNEITRWFATGVGKIREDRDGKSEVLKSYRLGPAVVAPMPRPVVR